MDYKVQEVEHAALIKMFIVYMQMQSNVVYQCDEYTWVNVSVGQQRAE